MARTYSARRLARVARLLLVAFVVPVVGWSSGCMTPGQPVAEGIPVRRLPAEILGRCKSELQPIPLTLLRQPEPDAYRVDRGDVLTVYAEDVLGIRNQIPVQSNTSPNARKPATQGYPVTVQDDGTIQIPEIPPLPVRGKTLNEVRAAVVKAITVDKKLIVPGKERVTVDLLQPRRYRVLVVREDGSPTAGETAACGDGKKGSGHTLMLEAYHNDVLEALNRTGGFPGPCARNEVVIHRGSGRDANSPLIRIPLKIRPGEAIPFTENDIILQDGDTLHIEARGDESYTVIGGPAGGRFALPRDSDIRILEALAKAVSPTPDSGFVTVLRSIDNHRQVPIRVDLREALRDPRENLLILPGDVIVLPDSRSCGSHDCAPKHSSSWRFSWPGLFSPIGPHLRSASGTCTSETCEGTP